MEALDKLHKIVDLQNRQLGSLETIKEVLSLAVLYQEELPAAFCVELSAIATRIQQRAPA